MEMMLKLPVALEAESVNDSHDGGRIGPQARSKSAHAQENIVARVLEDGANNFLALLAQLIDALSEINVYATAGGGHGAILYTIKLKSNKEKVKAAWQNASEFDLAREVKEVKDRNETNGEERTQARVPVPPRAKLDRGGRE